jgi:hypothetical protein
MHRLAIRQTPFQRIEVWGTPDETEFRVTGAIHAWWHRHRFLTGLAWDNIAAGIVSHPTSPRRILMLGLGGGTSLRTLRHLLPSAQLTANDIDPVMIAMARDFMDLDAINADIITADAYHWLLANRHRFDVIFDDVYGVTADDVARPSLFTPQLAAALRRSLLPSGIFSANLVIGPGHRRVQSIFRRFFLSNFPVVRSIKTEDSLNETLVGGPALRPWQSVRSLASSFPSNDDYCFWRRLAARRLTSPPAPPQSPSPD